jgi:hypothetical protein
MWVNRHVERYAKRFDDARHRASEALTEMFGGESLRTRSEAELRRLEQTYWKALKDGRIRLKPGVSTIQLAELLRAGRLLDARDLIERTDAPKPGPSEAGAEVWRLAGRPEIYISPAVDNWRPGMTVRYTVENSVSASSLTHRSKYLVADKKTGARRPNKSIDRVHIATVSVGSLPALLIADNPVQMTLSASIKQVMGRGKRSIEGAVSGTGIAVTSDSKFKNKVWASSGKQEQMTVTYTLSVTRSSSNIKKLVVHSPGVGKLTWTYHAAIGVSADDALEQLSREEKKRGR